jgi:hypothetical protein
MTSSTSACRLCFGRRLQRQVAGFAGDVMDGGIEPIASPRQGLDGVLVAAEDLADRRNLDFYIVFMDIGGRPDFLEEIFLGHQQAARFHQDGQQVECATSKLDGRSFREQFVAPREQKEAGELKTYRGLRHRTVH